MGFDWPNGDPSPTAKVEEELNELKDCIANGAAQEATEEEQRPSLCVANLSNLKADPEITLHKACVKFAWSSVRWKRKCHFQERVERSTLDELEISQKARQDNGETVGLQST